MSRGESKEDLRRSGDVKSGWLGLELVICPTADALSDLIQMRWDGTQKFHSQNSNLTNKNTVHISLPETY